MRLLVLCLAALTFASPLRAQDSLAAARELYASAAYEEALTELERAKGRVTPEAVAQVEQYRAFSLYALGRTDEAEKAAEAVVRQDPLLKLDSRDTSPKVEALFKQVQKRLLPTLLRERFRAARAAIDGGQLETGLAQLDEVQKMVAVVKALEVPDEGLADLALLADGFADLTRQALDRKAAAAAAPAAAAVARVEEAAIPAPRPVIYSSVDKDVNGPIALRQDIPAAPASLAAMMKLSKRSGVVEVRIDETGAVESAVMRERVNDMFDAMILQATKSWKYRPATRGGVPVKYLKHVGVTLQAPRQEDDE
jgi:TonB family protein